MGLINKIYSESQIIKDSDKISDFKSDIVEYSDRKKDVTNSLPIPKISLFSKYKYYIIGIVLVIIYFKFFKKS